jgi:hypothetical protein
MDQALERLGHEPRRGEFLFESWRDTTETARLITTYVLKFGAKDVRLAVCGDYLWVRLQSANEATSLLFRRRSPITLDSSRPLSA